MTCPSCGGPIPEGARFCPACGQTLVARPDERRVATVLFADLVGFTTFSERADPENVKNLVDRCFERLAGDITAFGGRVDKIVGDAMMALFGAPIAHEDDPERAVRAGLALQDSMRAFCSEHGVAVQLRIGVNTGEVLVGGIRAGDDYTAMGDVVNAASRLQAEAAPGEVLVGPDTYAATHAAIAYEPAGTLTVRGREHPIETWVAREPLTRPGRRVARGDVALIGRDAELSLLRRAIATVSQRRRALLAVIVGEAGVGKSRLAGEVAHSIPAAPTTVLIGHCVPYGEANIWSPIGDALRPALELESASLDDAESGLVRRVGQLLELPPDDDETRRVVSGLLWMMGRSDAMADVDPGRARDEALRSVHRLFEALTEQSLVVLVLSDLHWADDAIHELVDSLLARLRDRPFVLVVTARPELAEHWNPSVRHEATVLHLEALEADATRALIRSHLGSHTPDAVVDLLLERSGGNPFFIEELAALVAESDLDLQALATVGPPEERIRAVPATLRGLVAARLDALDELSRDVLEDCAVAGSTGPLDLVVALGESRGETETPAHLRTLAERGLLTIDPAEYAFRSELVREIAYGTLTKADRARRHAAVAIWHDTRGDEHERETERLEQLAMHYGAAAELSAEVGGLDTLPTDLRERAVRAHEAAARSAERAEVWSRAARHYEASIALGDDDDPHHVERLLGLVRAHVERHQLDQVRDDLDRANDLAAHADDPVVLVHTMLVRGLFEHRSGRYDEAVAAYDEAIERARELRDQQSVAEALRGRGLALMFRGDLDDAEDSIEAALDGFRTIEDRRGEAWCLQNLAWIAFYRGQPALADERLTAAIAMFTELRDWGGLDWAIGLHAWVRFNQGRLLDAQEMAQRVLAHSEDSGDLWALGMMGVLLAQVALWTGHPAQAIDHSLEAQERFDAIGDAYGHMQSLIPRARALACLGRLDAARLALESMVDVAKGLGDSVAKGLRDSLPALQSVLSVSIGTHIGDVDWFRTAPPSPDARWTGISAEEQGIGGGIERLQAGDVEAALEALERSYSEASSDAAVAAVGGILAMARAAAGNAQGALALTDHLVDLDVGSYLDRLQAWMARALAAAQLTRADALAAADRAIALADETESPLDHTITRLAQAIVLERLGDPAAGPARDDAHARLAELGIAAPGWTAAFRLASQGADEPATST